MEATPFANQKAGALEQAFLDALTTYLRAAILYPPHNRRVQEAKEALLEAVRILSAEGKKAVFRFSRSRILLGEGVLDPEPPQALWLKDRFSRTGLGGLTVLPTVEEETLYSFAQKLAENFKAPKGKRTFRQMWGDDFPGLELEELCFLGECSGAASTEFLRRDLAGAFKGEEALAVRRIFRALEESARIQEGLERVQKAIRAAGGGKPQHKVDLLDRIIQNLPSEALGDPDLSLKFVELSLQEVEKALAGGVQPWDSKEEEILRDLLDTVGCGLFGRAPLLRKADAPQEEEEELDVSSLPKWEREEDKRILHDLEALLYELESLPDLGEDPFEDFERSVVQEALGACLHLACLNPDPHLGEQVEHLLRALLAVTRPGDVGVIQPYVDPLFHKEKEEEGIEQAREVLAFLQRAGGERVLQECGSLTPVSAAATFPRTFPLFLDGLDSRDPGDLEKIREVCRILGPKRILEAKDFLESPLGILTPHRVDLVLSVPGKEVLPLVEMILEEGEMEDLVKAGRYLRALKLDPRGAGPFRVLQAEVPLPPEYLLGVCRAARKGSWPDSLKRESFRLLRQWAARPELDPEKRIRLLKALAPSRDPETRELLEILKKGKEPGGKGKVPRPLRKEAKAILNSPAWKGRS